MAELTSVTFTALFKQWRGGDREAGEELFRMIYQDLLRLAQSYLNGDRAGRAIQATTRCMKLICDCSETIKSM